MAESGCLRDVHAQNLQVEITAIGGLELKILGGINISLFKFFL